MPTSTLSPKLAVSYCRVSTDRQGSDGIGLELQKIAIDAFAQAAGYTIVESYAEAVSGAEELGKRPALRQALRHAVEQRVSLIVHSLSRLSRSTETMEAIIRDHDVSIVSASDGATGKAVIIGQVARAEAERREISERTKKALQSLKAQGVQLGNNTNLDEAQKLGAEKNVAAKWQKADEILAAFRAAGLTREASAQAMVDVLNRAGVRTRQGREWNKSSVRGPGADAWTLDDERTNAALRKNPGFGRFA